jgi:hypothetical protein
LIIRKVAISAIVIIALFFFASVEISHAQGITIGVSKGDTFTYKLVGFGRLAYNESEWIRFTVTDISGSTISLTHVLHLKDGSETTSETSINIQNGRFSGGEWIPPIVLPADLQANDNFYVCGYISQTPLSVLETTLSTYSQGQRETNHATNESEYKSEIYFDKQTGVLLEYSNLNPEDGEIWKLNYTNSFPFNPIETFSPKSSNTPSPNFTSSSPSNLSPSPSIPEFPSIIILVGITLLILVGVMIFRKKQTK